MGHRHMLTVKGSLSRFYFLTSGGAHCQDQERTEGRLSRGVAQVRGSHGDAEAQTTAEKCRTTLKLRCAAARD